MVKALLLDLDDTLLDDRGATRRAFTAFLASHRPIMSKDESETDALARWQKISRMHWPRAAKFRLRTSAAPASAIFSQAF